MKKQIIISISREFGTDGHNIAKKIGQDFGIEYYDRKILGAIAEKLDVRVDVLQKYDEHLRNPFLSRRVGKYTNSIEEILMEIQFDYIRSRAESGESFVVVGRCSDAILKDYPGLIRIFISGYPEKKKIRVMEKYSLSEQEAVRKIQRHDRNRKKYHNRYADTKWGDSRYYDMCINNRTGVEKTAEIIEGFIRNIIDE